VLVGPLLLSPEWGLAAVLPPLGPNRFRAEGEAGLLTDLKSTPMPSSHANRGGEARAAGVWRSNWRDVVEHPRPMSATTIHSGSTSAPGWLNSKVLPDEKGETAATSSFAQRPSSPSAFPAFAGLWPYTSRSNVRAAHGRP